MEQAGIKSGLLAVLFILTLSSGRDETFMKHETLCGWKHCVLCGNIGNSGWGNIGNIGWKHCPDP